MNSLHCKYKLKKIIIMNVDAAIIALPIHSLRIRDNLKILYIAAALNITAPIF